MRKRVLLADLRAPVVPSELKQLVRSRESIPAEIKGNLTKLQLLELIR